jgi:hypothetical protein
LNPGHRRQCLKKIVYPGHRRMAHNMHLLRKMSTGHRDYTVAEQIDFYEGEGHETDGMNVRERYKNIVIEELRTTTPYVKSMLPERYTPEALLQIKENRSAQLWYNYDYFITDFIDDLHYPMRDERESLPYITVTTETAIEDGMLAMQLRAGHVRGQARIEHVNGFTGVPPLLRLPYYRHEDSVYDLMHYASNTDKHNIDFHKGKIGFTDANRKLCLALGTHASLKNKRNKPRWLIGEPSQDLIDAVCNTMYVPAGHKDKFNLQWPMRHTKHLRAKDHLVFLTVYAPYLYSFSEMVGSYRKYTERLGSDLSRLLNPCLPEEDLEDLFWSVLETKMVHEGLVPESEQYFICHELIDIVAHVKKLGHVKAFMCFAGERSLSTISKNCPVGGVHYLKALFYKYCALENSLSKAAKTPTDYAYFDNDNLYNDFTLKLVGRADRVELNSYLMNSFLLELIRFIDAQGIEHVELKSPTRRLYAIYKQCKDAGQLNDEFGFAEWLTLLYTEYQTPAVGGNTIVDRISMLMLADPNGPHHLLDSDFPGIIKELVTFVPLCFSRAVVKGVKFRGRGIEYSEDSFYSRNVRADGVLREEHVTHIPESRADYRWWTSMQYSCWIGLMNNPGFIGQFNGCFRLRAPSDNVVNGLAFANITFHRVKHDPQRAGHPYIRCATPLSSYFGKRHFACLNDVKSTAFMVSGLDSQDLPICKSEAFSSFNWNKSRDNLPISDNPDDLARLYFISMYPEREHFQYENIETDRDRTRIFEQLN